MKPIRVQRKRAAGFKLPENTICVDRTSRYGNPWRVGDTIKMSVAAIILDSTDKEYFEKKGYLISTNKEAVYLFEKYTLPSYTDEDKERLRGKNIACFCGLHSSCHGDKILEWANG